MKKAYCELIDQFVDNLQSFNAHGMPAVHIPIIGKRYNKSSTKIAFFGIETAGWHPFQEFMEKYAGDGKNEGSTEKAYDYLVNSTNPIDYLKWRNNFHNNFWDFIFNFLLKFYGLPISNYETNEKFFDILESFIWGNTNSLEGYNVSAEKQGAQYNDWDHVKKASKIFDTAKYVLDICKPDLLLILNWTEDEKWLTGDQKTEHIELSSHIWYYKTSKTNVYWLANPRYICSPFGIGFDKTIEIVINHYNESTK